MLSSVLNSPSLTWCLLLSFLSHFVSVVLPSAFTRPRVVLTFPMFISSTGTTICGWTWPHCIVAQAQTHVIIILSNIGRVEKDCHDRKYTSFILGPRSCRGKRTHKSLILAQHLVGEIKQRQTASPSRDGAPDKDLSMAHFSGTEGWKEGGVVWRGGEWVQVTAQWGAERGLWVF